jgi:hypothetical protein
MAAAAAIATTVGMAGGANASLVTIYQDSFSRTANLNGTSPDVVDATAATWIAASSITTNGVEVGNSTDHNAFLPFAPAAGHVYTLSADLDAAGGSTGWLALGFAGGADTNSYWHFDLGASADTTVVGWLLQTPNGPPRSVTVFDGPSTAGGSNPAGYTSAAGYQSFSIALDTTAAAWTVTYAGPGFSQTDTYGTNPTITHVGFGNAGDTGRLDNFKLTDFVAEIAVPEPASLSLLALGGLSLLARRRR